MIRSREWYLCEYVYENGKFLYGIGIDSSTNPNGTERRFQPAAFIDKGKLEKRRELLSKMRKDHRIADMLYWTNKAERCNCARCDYHRSHRWLDSQPPELTYDVLPVLRLREDP
jgi:hypothetical protein